MTSTKALNKRRFMVITSDDKIIEQLKRNRASSVLETIITDVQDKRILPVHSLSNEDKYLSRSKRTKNGSLSCVVCGSVAFGYNFDAITCESCKAFFRRNGLKSLSTLKCRRDGSCVINVATRRRCSSCRLAKCLRNGMKPDRLFLAVERISKRQTVEENEVEFDDFFNDLFPDGLGSFSPLSGIDDFLPSVQEAPKMLMSNDDFKILENIQTFYEQRLQLALRAGLPWNPSEYSYTLLECLNARSVSAIRLLTFFKQIPEFNRLHVDDKVTLVKYNMISSIILNGALSYNSEADQIIEADTDVPWSPTIIRDIHGNEVYFRIKRLFQSLANVGQNDNKIILLAMIVLIFTDGFYTESDEQNSVLSDNIPVFQAQTYYTDLLWRYMETVLGTFQAAQVFQKFVTYIIHRQAAARKTPQNVRRVLSPTEINNLVPLMKSLLHVS